MTTLAEGGVAEGGAGAAPIGITADAPSGEGTTERLSERRASAGRGRLRRLIGITVPPLIVAVVMIGFWYFMSYVVLDAERRFLLPPPQQVVTVGFLNWQNFSQILVALWTSTQVALVGLGISIVLGMAFAIAMSQGRWVQRSFYPWAVVLQTIPILALVPLVGFWFKYGFTSRVIVCVLISLFPIITNTLFGLQSVDRSHHDLFTLHRASRVSRLWKLQLPTALPAIFTGLRIAAGLSVIGAIVGDFFFQQGQAGIGRLIDNYTEALQSQQLFAAVIMAVLLGLTIFWLFGLLGRLVVGSWHEAYPGRDDS
jgi:NitT/TauT family transport system permease protein